MPIGDSYKTNFDTLRRAAENGDLCLLEVYDRITGKPAVMLCAGFTDEEEHVNLIPLAQMCDSNPYETHVVETEDIAKYIGVVKGPEGHESHWVEVRADDGEVTHLEWQQLYSKSPRHPGSPTSWLYEVSTLSWGNSVSSDKLCAWMLLYHHLEDEERAAALHLQFHKEVIRQLPEREGWSMSAKELDSWIHHAEHPEEDSDGTSDEAPADGQAPSDDA